MFTVRHYSQALFLCAKEAEKPAKFLFDLELVCNLIKKEKEFRKFLLNPEILFEEKTKILKSIFKNEILPQIYNFLFLLIEKNSLDLLENIFYHFKRLFLEGEKIQEVEVVSSVTLSLSLKNKITKLLTKKIGKKVRLREFIDPKILGGMVIKVGDNFIDLSLRKKLELLQKNLV
ncbi:MAG: ATP synthase F1 subunit delta [Patescibacteria group bacterium]